MKSNTKDPYNNRQMSVEIAWKQNILITDCYLLKSLLVVFGFGSQAFICGFSRQNINSVHTHNWVKQIFYGLNIDHFLNSVYLLNFLPFLRSFSKLIIFQESTFFIIITFKVQQACCKV